MDFNKVRSKWIFCRDLCFVVAVLILCGFICGCSHIRNVLLYRKRLISILRLSTYNTNVFGFSFYWKINFSPMIISIVISNTERRGLADRNLSIEKGTVSKSK